jgi:hypothetical protein
VLLGSVLFLLGTSTLMAAQPPKPGPEAGKLAVWVGAWTYEGETQAGPLGPAAKVSGRETARLVMDGFALEWTAEETGLFGGVRWGEMWVYDPVGKSYPFLGYQNDGSFWSGTVSSSGSDWKFTGTWTVKGTAYKWRQDRSFSPDGKTWTWKDEISSDGKTWVPLGRGKVTKR